MLLFGTWHLPGIPGFRQRIAQDLISRGKTTATHTLHKYNFQVLRVNPKRGRGSECWRVLLM